MTERTVDRALQAEAFNGADLGDGLKTVRLVPDGITESTNGRFTLDAEAAALMIEGFDRQGVELVIDFEHQTLGGAYSAPNGQAPAAGWITKLWYERDRGVLALVRWNPKTRDAIREGSYGYVSPVLIIRKSDGKAIGLHSAAVTNRPAIPRLERLAASQNTNAETKAMADENAAIAASVRERLGLPVTANADAIAVALSVRTSGGGAESAELAAMKQAEAEREAVALVDRYCGGGRLNPNDKPAVAAAHRLALSQPETLRAIFENMIPQCPPGRTTPPSGRQTTIALAEREFRSNPAHSRSTSLQAFVANALREKGLPKLTETETSELSIA